MRKRIFAIVCAIVFAIAGVTTLTVALYTYNNSPVVSAAISTSETRLVQQRLKSWGYYTGSVDGIYGTLTKSAVRKFQQNNGLQVDGIVGPQTAAAIGFSIKSDSNSTSNSDLYLLGTRPNCIQCCT